MISNKVLLVDDNKGQRVTLESILKRAGFEVVSADCGTMALSIADAEDFAAALLDIKMPDITGIDVLRELKGKKPNITVIMMTGYAETNYAIDALNAGASAYILKPANIDHIKQMLNQAIERQRLIVENQAMAQALREWNSQLEKKISDRTKQLTESYRMTVALYEEFKKNFESTLEVLSIAIDQRDHLTSSHSFRVTQYALEVGKVMGLNSEDLEKLRYSGLLHDLGKIEVREDVLCKEGSLTSEEYKHIQSHVTGTFELLSRFRFKNNLADVPLIASSHHERFDGKGYPRGLKNTDIHPLARILGVADVFDAITSRRHYRSAMSIVDALSIMKREAGGHFDLQCVDALFRVSAGVFVSIHMADHLGAIDTGDLMELGPVNLQDIYSICQTQNPTAAQITLLQRFYNYYQGPLPLGWEGKIKPGHHYEEPLPKNHQKAA